MKQYSQEFKNLITLLESESEDSFRLGLQLAQHYQEEFLDYFGCEIDKLEELCTFLVENETLLK